jgi:hypothetical protein
MSHSISLCLNCLARGKVTAVPVGQEKGSQRDPYRETLSLCETCGQALVLGDFAALHARYQSETTVNRGVTES